MQMHSVCSTLWRETLCAVGLQASTAADKPWVVMLCRGKIKSLEDASATTAGHVQLLLGDVAAVCSSKAAGSADDVKVQAEKLQKVSGGLIWAASQSQPEPTMCSQLLVACRDARHGDH